MIDFCDIPISYYELVDQQKYNKYNRFQNVVPYKNNRIIIPENICDGFINASYVTDNIIATQFPLENTLYAFWTMIIQENVTVIVNLQQFDNDICKKYIAVDKKISLHDYIIDTRFSNKVMEGFADKYKIIITNKKTNSIYCLDYIYYMHWPDMTAITLEEFKLLVNYLNDEYSNTKMVIHCLAGVGRTGTVITGLEIMKKNTNIYVFDIIVELRTKKPYLVQKTSQYELLQLFAEELVTLGNNIS